MEKLIAYKMSVSEGEEILQNVLDDAGIRLVSEANAFYSAYSDSQELDGSQVDRRIAQYLGVQAVENHVAEGMKMFSQIKKNAILAAERDGYNRIILRCSDGTFSFTREAYGRPVTPLFEDEQIVGRVVVSWVSGCAQVRFIQVSG